MVYESKNFTGLIGIEGLSENLLNNHFKLYEGYVKNTNDILAVLNKLSKEGKSNTPEFAELKRRFGWEFNGMRLHEYYFENITKSSKGIDKKSGLFKKIAEDFGSYEEWEKNFKAIGGIRGIGWVVLYYDRIAKRLFNVWVNEHDSGHLAGASVILVIDVFEHAFIVDYGLKKAEYIEAFFKVIDWKSVAERFE